MLPKIPPSRKCHFQHEVNITDTVEKTEVIVINKEGKRETLLWVQRWKYYVKVEIAF